MNAPTCDNPTVLTEKVIDIGNLGRFNEDEILETIARKMGDWSASGCSAIARRLPDGGILVGRNMDLSVSNKPAYVFILEGERCRSRGIAYTFKSGEDFADPPKPISLKNARCLAFTATDFINETGLYLETNMRPGEVRDSEQVFACRGTNPGGKRILFASFAAYASTRCSNVPEFLELAKKMDFYTPSKDFVWNFATMAADAEGNCALLEAIDDKLFATTLEGDRRVCRNLMTGETVFSEDSEGGTMAQTNFFTVPEYEKMEQNGCGYGRMKTIKDGIRNVSDLDGMLGHMRKAYYSQSYLPYGESAFDVRSEWSDCFSYEGKACNTRWLCDERNSVVAEKLIGEQIAIRQKMDWKAKVDSMNYWNTEYSVAADCRRKVMKVIFWEDPEACITIGF